MDRPVGWPKALREYAAVMDGAPFEWGVSDCGTLVRQAASIVLGADPWKASYSSEKGARRALKGLAGPDGALEAAGAVRVPLAFAQQGDVLVNPDPDGHDAEVGIIVGGGVLSAATETGAYWRAGIPAWECWRLEGGSRAGTDG